MYVKKFCVLLTYYGYVQCLEKLFPPGMFCALIAVINGLYAEENLQ